MWKKNRKKKRGSKCFQKHSTSRQAFAKAWSCLNRPKCHPIFSLMCSDAPSPTSQEPGLGLDWPVLWPSPCPIPSHYRLKSSALQYQLFGKVKQPRSIVKNTSLEENSPKYRRVGRRAENHTPWTLPCTAALCVRKPLCNCLSIPSPLLWRSPWGDRSRTIAGQGKDGTCFSYPSTLARGTYSRDRTMPGGSDTRQAAEVDSVHGAGWREGDKTTFWLNDSHSFPSAWMCLQTCFHSG